MAIFTKHFELVQFQLQQVSSAKWACAPHTCSSLQCLDLGTKHKGPCGVTLWLCKALRASFAGHIASSHRQDMAALQVRIAMAWASALNRTLVLPELWCGADRWWAPHAGRIPGAALRLPFQCPLDHVLDLEQCALLSSMTNAWGQDRQCRSSHPPGSAPSRSSAAGRPVPPGPSAGLGAPRSARMAATVRSSLAEAGAHDALRLLI